MIFRELIALTVPDNNAPHNRTRRAILAKVTRVDFVKNNTLQFSSVQLHEHPDFSLSCLGLAGWSGTEVNC